MRGRRTSGPFRPVFLLEASDNVANPSSASVATTRPPQCTDVRAK